MNNRNLKLDLLRFLGVVIIMVAHASPPFWLFQLRNFGTPLLIMASALTYAYIYKSRSIELKKFYKKRLTRLTIPIWIFLTFFFLFFYISCLLLNKEFMYTTSTIIRTYLYYDGIGFVWIFKIYLLLALITPIALKFSKSAISNLGYFFLLFSIYIIHEFTFIFSQESIPIDYKDLMNKLVLILVPYISIYFYGLRAHLLNNRQILVISFLSFLVFFVLAYLKYSEQGHFVATQKYKNPPSVYYISYAFGCINLIYLYTRNYLKLNNPVIQKGIVWLSSNSLWIYLWHIMGISVWLFIGEERVYNYFGQFGLFILKFVFIFSFGIIATYIQLFLVNKLLGITNKKIVTKTLIYLK